MDPQWDDSLPIYRQLRDRVVAMILEGVVEGRRSAAVGPERRSGIQAEPPDGIEGLPAARRRAAGGEARGLGMFVSLGRATP